MAGMNIEDLARLPLEERLRAMEVLWNSLLDAEDTLPAPRWHAAVLDEGVKQFDPAKASPLTDVMARIRDSLPKR